MGLQNIQFQRFYSKSFQKLATQDERETFWIEMRNISIDGFSFQDLWCALIQVLVNIFGVKMQTAKNVNLQFLRKWGLTSGVPLQLCIHWCAANRRWHHLTQHLHSYTDCIYFFLFSTVSNVSSYRPHKDEIRSPTTEHHMHSTPPSHCWCWQNQCMLALHEDDIRDHPPSIFNHHLHSLLVWTKLNQRWSAVCIIRHTWNGFAHAI